MSLPEPLRSAIEGMMEGLSEKALARAAAELSARYRGTEPRGQSYLTSREDVLAYAAFRMPATYAAVHSALGHAAALLGGFAPTTLLDAGSGPGTAMWAALDLYPGIQEVTLVERDARMLALGRHLTQSSPVTSLRSATWLEQDLLRTGDFQRADLVIAAYTLGELPSAGAIAVVERLWAATQGMLLLVEPGTPEGFSRIRAWRSRLLELGANMVAPCPHAAGCPIVGSDWCHFSARLGRTGVQRRLKGGDLSYEDEKFSYVSVSRSSPRAVEGRVVRHPKSHSGHVELRLCTSEGLRDETISRRHGDLFRRARRAAWGSPWTPSSPDPEDD